MNVQNIDTKVYYGQENLKEILEKMLRKKFMEMFKQERK